MIGSLQILFIRQTDSMEESPLHLSYHGPTLLAETKVL